MWIRQAPYDHMRVPMESHWKASGKPLNPMEGSSAIWTPFVYMGIRMHSNAFEYIGVRIHSIALAFRSPYEALSCEFEVVQSVRWWIAAGSNALEELERKGRGWRLSRARQNLQIAIGLLIVDDVQNDCWGGSAFPFCYSIPPFYSSIAFLPLHPSTLF